ncbi:MAG: TRAP transporter large permease [Pseudolabrys sp.]|jgi:C4-dicarboxylate transporter, DctM subunit
MNAIFLFGSLLAMLAIGLPVAMALGLASVLTIIFFQDDSLASLALKFFQTMDHFTLLAIPFFILAGNFLTTGGVARRMINFAIAAVGHLPGGLAIASVLACMLFAAVSGSSPATVVAIGSIVIAGMVRVGYSESFATGVIVNAGTLGILIPPSITMVIFAAVTDSSVGRLFIGGVVPGILLGLALMIAIYMAARIKKLPRQPKASWAERLKLFLDAFWGLLLIFIVLGGIYGGVFTPTEAASVAAVYAFFTAVVIYRDLKLADVPRVLLESSRVSVMLMFIICNAFLFGYVLTVAQIPQQIAQMIVDAHLAQWQFLLVVNIILLVAGNFMDPAPIVLITAPILFPTAMKLGIDPIHLGVLYVVNMEIGLVTPPVGLNLFVASGITGQPLMTVVRAALPWLMVLLGFLIVVTYIPQVTLWLPNLLMGKPV